MTDSTYLRSLQAIRPREVALLQERRENGYYRQTAPLQRLVEKALVAAWQVHQRGEAVTAESIHAQDPELTPMQVAELCESPYFRQALAARGIPGAEHLDKLTGEQLTVLQVMTDPTISTPVMQRLKRLGVPYKRWQGWLRQPAFAAAYQSMLDKLGQDLVGAITLSMQEQALAGKVDAAKLALELAGAYVPGASTMQEERRLDMVVQRMQTAIDRFVDDATRVKIAYFIETGEMPPEDLGEVAAVPSLETSGQ